MTRSEFLQELRLQYEKEFERKTTLENKGNYLIAISGIVISIFFTFGTFLIEKIDTNYYYLDLLKIQLVVVLSLNVCSIFLGVIGFLVTKYRYAFRGENFGKIGQLNMDEVEAYIAFTNEQMQDKMIKAYLRCNSVNRKGNDNKSKVIFIAQVAFLASFIFIPIMLTILFVYPPNILK